MKKEELTPLEMLEEICIVIVGHNIIKNKRVLNDIKKVFNIW